jgi:hypothetical protein
VGGWKNLHNEKLHDLSPSSNITTVIKSRKMRWAGHEARTGEMRNREKFWSENLNIDRSVTSHQSGAL